MKKYDLAVIGGGFAGVAAAIAAARGGKSVILVEKGNSLGGAAANSLVFPFMPNSTKINGEHVELSAGIFGEICEKLHALDAMKGIEFNDEILKHLLGEMALENGIDLLYHAYIFKAENDNGIIKAVYVATKIGEIKIEADTFIDATGDAQLTYLAGLPTTLGRDGDHLCQPMTLCFRVGNVDVERFWAAREELNATYKKHFDAGEFINPRENILVFKTLVPNMLHFNTTRVVKKNPTDPFDVTEAEIIARRQVFEMYDFLKANAKGFENSCLLMTASEIGVRESRMIVGEYILTEKECRDCTKFDDAIAACNYDIDIHNPEGAGTSHYYFGPGEYYTIPYRCLIPKGAKNMLVAGRCISSDHGAQASYRIMPTVCTIGEAAGTAMSLYNGTDVRDVDVKKLQEILKKNNAFIGI
jgi:hypothetical protein